MLKKLISISFALVFLFQGGVRLFIIADYNIRKEKIAATLCVNTFNPSKHCEGHCYLEKQLKKQQEKESQLPNFLKEKGEIKGIINEHIIRFQLFHSELIHIESYRKDLSIKKLASIFHPPPNFSLCRILLT